MCTCTCNTIYVYRLYLFFVQSCQEICEHNIHSLLETLLTGKNIPASSNGTIVEISEGQEEEVLTGPLLNGTILCSSQ